MNLKLFTVASVTAALALAAGCVVQQNQGFTSTGDVGGAGPGSGPGSGPGTGPGTGPASSGAGTGASDARKFYVSDVHPLLMGTSDPAHSCTACHATGANNAPAFMDMAAETCYDKMDAYTGLIVAPENSQLLLHGLHTGPAMSQTQKDTVSHWLTMEAQARGLPTGGGATSTASGGMPTMTLDQWLAQVGKCMDINDWKANGLDGLSKAQTFNQGPCGGCHSAGEGGNYLDTLDPTTTFNMQQVTPYVKRWFKPQYTNGAVSGLDPNPREYLKGQEISKSPCQPAPGKICHPSYLLDPTLMTGVDTFIKSTLTRMANKQCAP